MLFSSISQYLGIFWENGREMLTLPGILFNHEILFFFELLTFNFLSFEIKMALWIYLHS